MPNMNLLNDKKVLITGALGTIGQALVKRYAEVGATVIGLDRPHLVASRSVQTAESPAITYVGCDLNDLDGTEAFVHALADQHAGLDILVNNAAYVIKKSYEKFSYQEYDDQMRVNSAVAFVLTRVCAEHMIKKNYGKMVNITSMTLTGHWDGFVPYIASKGALLGLIKGFARELGAHGINVNGISPGAVVSDAEFRDWADSREHYHQWILDRQCLKRRIEAVDIANLAVFLSSSQSDLITGQNIQVDGGW
jgi:NAD(P)-dependent dehydrogenase (short-subunit alcohol dehydrogenase family)